MRFPFNIIISCGVIAVALAVGVLRPGLTSATLQRHAQQSVVRCMHEAGFDQNRGPTDSLSIEQASSPRDQALERCWSNAANDPKFQTLALTDPVAYGKLRRDEGFKAWRCAERSGYVRTSEIPLSAPDGYPLQLAAGNFRVGSSDRDLERFYRAAAKCSGDSIAAYRWSNGTFSPDPADGTHCIHHDHHGSGRHAHGCFGAATYPDLSAGSEQ
jgi:hypothetical protein